MFSGGAAEAAPNAAALAHAVQADIDLSSIASGVMSVAFALASAALLVANKAGRNQERALITQLLVDRILASRGTSPDRLPLLSLPSHAAADKRLLKAVAEEVNRLVGMDIVKKVEVERLPPSAGNDRYKVWWFARSQWWTA